MNSDKKLQAALSLLQYHVHHVPEAIFLPEFHQTREREAALLRAVMNDGDVNKAAQLYLSAIVEFDEAVLELSDSEREYLRSKNRKGLAPDGWF